MASIQSSKNIVEYEDKSSKQISAEGCSKVKPLLKKCNTYTDLKNTSSSLQPPKEANSNWMIGSGQVPYIGEKNISEGSPSCESDSQFSLNSITITNNQVYNDDCPYYQSTQQDNAYIDDLQRATSKQDEFINQVFGGMNRSKSMTPTRAINIENQINKCFNNFNYQKQSHIEQSHKNNGKINEAQQRCINSRQSQYNSERSLDQQSGYYSTQQNQAVKVAVNQIDEKVTLSLLKYNEKLNNIVSERNRKGQLKPLRSDRSSSRASRSNVTATKSQLSQERKTIFRNREPIMLPKKSLNYIIQSIKVTENIADQPKLQKVSSYQDHDKQQVKPYHTSNNHEIRHPIIQKISQTIEIKSPRILNSQSRKTSPFKERRNASPFREILSQRMKEIQDKIIPLTSQKSQIFHNSDQKSIIQQQQQPQLVSKKSAQEQSNLKKKYLISETVTMLLSSSHNVSGGGEYQQQQTTPRSKKRIQSNKNTSQRQKTKQIIAAPVLNERKNANFSGVPSPYRNIKNQTVYRNN